MPQQENNLPQKSSNGTEDITEKTQQEIEKISLPMIIAGIIFVALLWLISSKIF